MSDVCFKEFKGWCKSFTKTEIYLSLLQLIFLVLLITFLTFLVLHFLACVRDIFETEFDITPGNSTESTKTPAGINSTVTTIEPAQTSIQNFTSSTLGKGVKCTWTPSKKTDAVALYYEEGKVVTVSSLNVKEKFSLKHKNSSSQILQSDTKKISLVMNSDVDIVDNVMNSFILALVKVRHTWDILFGCTLTIVSSHWTLSAASCIEAIEEVDALDSFVMMEKFGEQPLGETHELSDVVIHPEYRGVNKSYNLAAIKSEDVLIKDGSPTITLPTLLDISLITLGERLGVLGFGKFSAKTDPLDQRLHEVSVYKLVQSQCRDSGTWAARHLVGEQAAVRGASGLPPGLCVGRVGAEAGVACPCGGAPLMRAHKLLGIMSDDGVCGLSCRPAFYVNLVLHRDWLYSVFQDD